MDLDEALEYGREAARNGPEWHNHSDAAFAAGALAAHLDQAQVQREIKSEGGRTWRRTVRVLAEDWVADEEEK